MSTAYFYVAGPNACYVRFPKVGAGPYVGPDQLLSAGTPTFLGHTQKTPKPSNEPKWKPVFSAQSGEVIPADKLYMGTDVKIRLTLARFDMDVVNALNAAPRYGRVTAPGTETYLDVGALLQRNGLSFELWLRNEFYGTANALAYPNLTIGTYFMCCNTVALVPDELSRDTEVVDLMIEANWVQAWPAGNRLCFTHNPKYFASLPTIG